MTTASSEPQGQIVGTRERSKRAVKNGAKNTICPRVPEDVTTVAVL